MLHGACLPLELWGEAVETASYLRNRIPIGPKGLTPEEAYSGKKPSISHLKAYGCLAYAYMPMEKRNNKLDLTAIRTCLVGYIPTGRQYRLYDLVGSRIIISIAPKIVEDKRLDFEWKDVEGDSVLPFNPMALDAIVEDTDLTLANPRPSATVADSTSLNNQTSMPNILGTNTIKAIEQPPTTTIAAASPRTALEYAEDPDMIIVSEERDSDAESTEDIQPTEDVQPTLRRGGRARRPPH
jgi:hypothetical protein